MCLPPRQTRRLIPAPKPTSAPAASAVSLLFLSYDHLERSCEHRLLLPIHRLISPTFATVAVQIDTRAYLWTPEKTHITTRQALRHIASIVTPVPIKPDQVDIDHYLLALLRLTSNPHPRRFYMAHVSRNYHNCATLASLLLKTRITTPDRLYRYLCPTAAPS